MKEVEVKILNVNKKEIEQKLIALGAKNIFDDYVDAIYYDIKQDNKNNNKKTLRLRLKGTESELSYKDRQKTKNVKISDEFEVSVSDFENMKKILHLLGYKIKTQIQKIRTSYILDTVRFELDTYPGEPTLLEIEASSLKIIEKYVKLLGYTMKDAKGWSYDEVLKYYKEKAKKKK